MSERVSNENKSPAAESLEPYTAEQRANIVEGLQTSLIDGGFFKQFLKFPTTLEEVSENAATQTPGEFDEAAMVYVSKSELPKYKLKTYEDYVRAEHGNSELADIILANSNSEYVKVANELVARINESMDGYSSGTIDAETLHNTVNDTLSVLMDERGKVIGPSESSGIIEDARKEVVKDLVFAAINNARFPISENLLVASLGLGEDTVLAALQELVENGQILQDASGSKVRYSSIAQSAEGLPTTVKLNQAEEDRAA